MPDLDRLLDEVMKDLGNKESFSNAIAADLRITPEEAHHLMGRGTQVMLQLPIESRGAEIAETLGVDWDELDEGDRLIIIDQMRLTFALALGTRLARVADLLDHEDPRHGNPGP